MGPSVESLGSGAVGTAAAELVETSVLLSGVCSAVSGDFTAPPDSDSLVASVTAGVPVIGFSDNSTGAAGLAASSSSGAEALVTLGPGGLALLVERRFLDLWLIALPRPNCTSKAGVCATSINRFK